MKTAGTVDMGCLSAFSLRRSANEFELKPLQPPLEFKKNKQFSMT